MLVVGAILFGALLGYVFWRWWDLERKPTLRTISAFIAAVGGAGITTLFPAGTELFGGYCIGLVGGFVWTPTRERITNARQRSQRSLQEEIKQIDERWPDIEKFVTALKRSSHLIDVSDLQRYPIVARVRNTS
jgi:hypothetical protein